MTPVKNLPVQPDLRLVHLEAASAGIVLVPFNRTRRTPLQIRQRYDIASLAELAQSIYERTVFGKKGEVIKPGFLQNLIGRPDPEREGGIEICAGERRQRAVELLVQGLNVQLPDGTDANGLPVTKPAFYQVSDDFPMPFVIEEMTDAQLIETAILENLQREDMDVMERADSYLALQQAGYTVPLIAQRAGKSVQTIESYLQMAVGLGKEGRKLLKKGDISVEHAKVIASTTGALKRSLTEQARAGATAQSLRTLLRAGAFQVETALFDVPASGLQIDGGWLSDVPPRFTDLKAALNCQLSALEAVKAEEEQGGKWGEVVVLPVESEYGDLPTRDWVWPNQRPEGVAPVLVLTCSTVTGQTKRYEGVARLEVVQAYEKAQQAQARAAKKAQSGGGAAQQGGSDKQGGAAQGQDDAGSSGAARPSFQAQQDTGKGVRDRAHELAHQTRAQALDAFFATHETVCLAAACEKMLHDLRHSSRSGLLGLRVTFHPSAPLTPETLALRERMVTAFPELFTVEGEKVSLNHSYQLDIMGVLTAPGVTLGELVGLFAFLTHQTAGRWEKPTERPSHELNAFAVKFGVADDLVNRFALTPDYLDAYKANDLVELIGTMPTALQPAYKHGCSKKELVGLIVEKAAALKEAGWVPELVKFKR